MKHHIQTFRSLLSLVENKTGWILQMCISSFLGHISSLLPPIATAGIIAMIQQGNIRGIFSYALLYILFYSLYFSSRYWRYTMYSKIANYYHLEVQRKLFEKIGNNEAIFEKLTKGKIIDTCSDDVRYLVDIIDAMIESVMLVVRLLIIFMIFLYYNPLIALFVLILNLFYLDRMDKNSRKIAKYYEGTRKYDDRMIDILNQMIGNIKQVKTLNMMPQLDNKLNQTRKKWQEQYTLRRYHMTCRYSIIPTIVYFGKILLYIILAFLVINNQMSLDQLVLLISYYEMVVTCTDELLTYLLDLSNYGVRINRIRTILSYSPQKGLDFGDLENDYIEGSIRFQNASYIVNGKSILKQVSFKIYPNEIHAIVGHSGSGKSTIFNLLYRLKHITSGMIYIDNESIYNYSSKVYSSNLSGVNQKTLIFEMSIRDNLSLIDKNIKHQIEVCKRVGLHESIMKLPNGYNTVLNEESTIFNAYQKQLLAIARALLTEAEILLFDEVTANFEPSITKKIAEVLLDLKTDHTILLITHKPDMMELADRVIVLEKGRVVAKGTNEEVYQKSSLYQELRSRTFASISREE